MSSTLKTKILAWLEKHGYPRELRAGEDFRAAGWKTQHSHVYRDLVEGKAREIDIVATVSKASRERPALASIDLLVECKSSPDKPRVVFTSPLDDSRVWNEANLPGWVATFALTQVERASDLLGSHDTKRGHSIVAALASGKAGDPTSAHAALQAAASAAAAWNESNAEFAAHYMGPKFPRVNIGIPVVVLDGLLYEYSIVDDAPSLTELDSIRVATANPIDPGAIVHVLVVRADVLVTAAAAWRQDAKELALALLPVAETVVTKHLEYLSRTSHSS